MMEQNINCYNFVMIYFNRSITPKTSFQKQLLLQKIEHFSDEVYNIFFWQHLTLKQAFQQKFLNYGNFHKNGITLIFDLVVDDLELKVFIFLCDQLRGHGNFFLQILEMISKKN